MNFMQGTFDMLTLNALAAWPGAATTSSSRSRRRMLSYKSKTACTPRRIGWSSTGLVQEWQVSPKGGGAKAASDTSRAEKQLRTGELGCKKFAAAVAKSLPLAIPQRHRHELEKDINIRLAQAGHERHRLECDDRASVWRRS